MIIGLTGTFSAGKDAVADYLEKKGFEHFSTGEEVSEIAKEQGLPTDRDGLRELANITRDKYGPEYLSKRALKKSKTDKVVITGLRQPGEIKYLQKQKSFYLIAVDAPIKLRFERMRKRARPGDSDTLEAMREKEQKEMQSTSRNAQKIHECMEMADFKIINDGNFERLYKNVEDVLEKIKLGTENQRGGKEN